MYVLKDTECPDCGDYIIVNMFEGFVDNGECAACCKKVILPEEDYFDFVRENCEYIKLYI